jgi:hypothetical protein
VNGENAVSTGKAVRKRKTIASKDEGEDKPKKRARNVKVEEEILVYVSPAVWASLADQLPVTRSN